MLVQIVLGFLRNGNEVSRLPEAAANVALVSAAQEAGRVFGDLAQRRAQRQKVVAMHDVRTVRHVRHPRAEGLVAKHVERVRRIAAQSGRDLAREDQVLINIASPLGQRRRRCQTAHALHRGTPGHPVAARREGKRQAVGKTRHALRAQKRGVREEDKVHAGAPDAARPAPATFGNCTNELAGENGRHMVRVAAYNAA